MAGKIVFSETAGEVAENEIKGAVSSVSVKSVAVPASSKLTAVDNGISCCDIQKTEVQEFKDNLSADAENIGNLAEKFVQMDLEQKMKNQTSFLQDAPSFTFNGDGIKKRN